MIQISLTTESHETISTFHNHSDRTGRRHRDLFGYVAKRERELGPGPWPSQLKPTVTNCRQQRRSESAGARTDETKRQSQLASGARRIRRLSMSTVWPALSGAQTNR